MEIEIEFMTATEAASRLCCGKKQISHLIRKGKLRGMRLGINGEWRVEKSSLEEFIRAEMAKYPVAEQVE